MAHTYIIQSSETEGPNLIITATVDGFQVSISVPAATINGLPNTAAVQAFLAPLLLAAAQAEGQFTVANPAVTAAGTWSQ